MHTRMRTRAGALNVTVTSLASLMRLRAPTHRYMRTDMRMRAHMIAYACTLTHTLASALAGPLH